MAPETSLSRRALITDASATLRLAGVTAPRREAQRLWCDLTGEDAAAPVLRPDESVDEATAARYVAAVKRRAAGEPLAHVSGWAGFRRLTLRSDRRALIPRPETEGLVDLVLERVRTGRAADIGTGSGCIALSLATEGRFDAVVGVDRSAEALALAEENRRLVGADVRFVRGDLGSALRPASVDALVSNPPYLSEGEYRALDASVRDWEPGLALASGDDGLAATARLLDEGRAVVRPGGWLALEVDSARAVEAADRATQLGWRDVSIHADLFGRERYLLAHRSDAS